MIEEITAPDIIAIIITTIWPKPIGTLAWLKANPTMVAIWPAKSICPEIPMLNKPTFWAKINDSAETANIAIDPIVAFTKLPLNGALNISAMIW